MRWKGPQHVTGDVDFDDGEPDSGKLFWISLNLSLLCDVYQSINNAVSRWQALFMVETTNQMWTCGHQRLRCLFSWYSYSPTPLVRARLKQPGAVIHPVFTWSLLCLTMFILNMGTIRANLREALAKKMLILKEHVLICFFTDVTRVVSFLLAGSRIQTVASPKPVAYFSRVSARSSSMLAEVIRDLSAALRGSDGGGWVPRCA